MYSVKIVTLRAYVSCSCVFVCEWRKSELEYNEEMAWLLSKRTRYANNGRLEAITRTSVWRKYWCILHEQKKSLNIRCIRVGGIKKKEHIYKRWMLLFGAVVRVCDVFCFQYSNSSFRMKDVELLCCYFCVASIWNFMSFFWSKQSIHFLNVERLHCTVCSAQQQQHVTISSMKNYNPSKYIASIVRISHELVRAQSANYYWTKAINEPHIFHAYAYTLCITLTDTVSPTPGFRYNFLEDQMTFVTKRALEKETKVHEVFDQKAICPPFRRF